MQSEDETIGGSAQHNWPEALDAEHVKALYLKWCERHRVHHPETPETLGRALRQEFGLLKWRPRTETGRAYRYKFPTLDEARSRFGREYGIPAAEWDRMDCADDG